MEYKGMKEYTDAGDADSEGKLKKANLVYVIVFVIIAILGFIVYNTGYSWIGKIIKTIYDQPHTVGISCAIRLTTTLALWFAIHSLICICNPNLENSWQFKFHSNFLFVHIICLIVLFVPFMFIPDSFFNVWFKICYFISGVYLVLQIIFLLAFFQDLNKKFYNEDKMWPIITMTVVFGVGSLVAFGVSYYIFVKEGCSDNNIFISINMILCIILFLASAFVEHGSIFTASLISCYVAYLTVAAMMCEPDCNRLSSGSQGIAFSIIASLFTLAWAGYSAFSTSNQFNECNCCLKEGEEGFFSLSFFHSLFAMASIYVTMIVTHWGKSEGNTAWATDRGTIAKWVNFAASWVVVLLYGWTLIAPAVCKDREFDF
ncbi:Serinc-domain containing serine and sphingolipid biosynthesis protein [Histomonas meleagridis]|uniref:Serinc-domain containing serine and sphingolipid biosynthesis protein n=1 Tax=Histomonas meleagridis TaxID=135588 RepID=UPI003559C34D|nr:Serinc-domain containing serine and sphingolipid biosynthesis protein [Histomonas meleagridis]KAH0797910.1 Serinc-domain containing serine and sphingolipid biosynthesis protein [Histomonas meleagridis]